jgi:hypothetical protein
MTETRCNGQMRPKSIGLGQIEGSQCGNRLDKDRQTERFKNQSKYKGRNMMIWVCMD